MKLRGRSNGGIGVKRMSERVGRFNIGLEPETSFKLSVVATEGERI